MRGWSWMSRQWTSILSPHSRRIPRCSPRINWNRMDTLQTSPVLVLFSWCSMIEAIVSCQDVRVSAVGAKSWNSCRYNSWKGGWKAGRYIAKAMVKNCYKVAKENVSMGSIYIYLLKHWWGWKISWHFHIYWDVIGGSNFLHLKYTLISIEHIIANGNNSKWPRI